MTSEQKRAEFEKYRMQIEKAERLGTVNQQRDKNDRPAT